VTFIVDPCVAWYAEDGLQDFLRLVQPPEPGAPSAFSAARSLCTPLCFPPMGCLLSLISSPAGWPALQRLDLQLDCGNDNCRVDVTAELQHALILLPALTSLTISRIALRDAAIAFLCSLPLTELFLEECNCYDRATNSSRCCSPTSALAGSRCPLPAV
jgi:hypothetical protein